MLTGRKGHLPTFEKVEGDLRTPVDNSVMMTSGSSGGMDGVGLRNST